MKPDTVSRLDRLAGLVAFVVGAVVLLTAKATIDWVTGGAFVFASVLWMVIVTRNPYRDDDDDGID